LITNALVIMILVAGLIADERKKSG